MYWLLWSILIISFLNLFLMATIGAFLVRFREDISKSILNLIELIQMVLENPQPEAKPEIPLKKTWDEKYEFEERIREEKRKQNTGLQDLSYEPVVSWGNPPAFDPKNAGGLTIDGVKTEAKKLEELK